MSEEVNEEGGGRGGDDGCGEVGSIMVLVVVVVAVVRSRDGRVFVAICKREGGDLGMGVMGVIPSRLMSESARHAAGLTRGKIKDRLDSCREQLSMGWCTPAAADPARAAPSLSQPPPSPPVDHGSPCSNEA
ncbi:hypothetical protein E2C01_075570 [Portunus trituberculatus]|uniref:Uncharacterized protein n=1 Tax=Portunus trituberculatus TaxID=210409 RepID=A0A5B7I8X8_PORTR|nr:hypothetical protein [Portunus trituberculatus]